MKILWCKGVMCVNHNHEQWHDGSHYVRRPL